VNISDKLKIKIIGNFSELSEEMVHVNRMNTGSFMLSAKRTKIRHPMKRWEENMRLQHTTWPNTWQQEEESSVFCCLYHESYFSNCDSEFLLAFII